MVILPRPRAAWLIHLMLIAAAATACNRPARDGAKPIRLVDAFDARRVEGSSAKAAGPVRPTEWRFDGPAPSPPPPPPAGARPSPAPFPATRGWEAGPGGGLAIRRRRQGKRDRLAGVVGEIHRLALPAGAIAARMGISLLTVRKHIQNALRRLGLHSKAAAVSFALRNGML